MRFFGKCTHSNVTVTSNRKEFFFWNIIEWINEYCCIVDGGHRAVIFDRFQGVKPDVIGEGTHFMIPWLHRPIVFDIRTRPRSVPSVTGTKGTIDNELIIF